MLIFTTRFSKKKAVLIVILLGLVIAASITTAVTMGLFSLF